MTVVITVFVMQYVIPVYYRSICQNIPVSQQEANKQVEVFRQEKNIGSNIQ